MEDVSEFRNTISAVARTYRSWRGVCGLSVGTKFSDGEKVEGVEAIQFFVTEKIPLEELERPLPRYVLMRDGRGKADRRRRVVTDIIELKNMELCCGSGSASQNQNGVAGTAALIFEDRVDGALKLLSCSHVVSDLVDQNSTFDLSGGANGCFFQARSLTHTVIKNQALEFDIALAEITAIDNFVDGAVAGAPTQLTGFASGDDLKAGTVLECTSRVSGLRSLTVESESSDFEEIRIFSGDSIQIKNLYACKGVAVNGDSGGIVFRDGRAVGMIVARAEDDWVFVHSLEDALEHLAQENGMQVQCFD